MKRRKRIKYRFYFWDYLWWIGEQLTEYNPRMSGPDIMYVYFLFLIFIPGMLILGLCDHVGRTASYCWFGAGALVIMVWLIWARKIYGLRRHRAVMRHYDNRLFYPSRAYIIFFFPLIFFIVLILIMFS